MTQEQDLLNAAWSARDQAHAPYSSFRVGAAIRTTGGLVFAGCNVENASFGGTICAERAAICAAVAAGALLPGQLESVLVATLTPKATLPCGVCRQVIEEFANPKTMILIADQSRHVVARYLHADLLPYAFGAANLDR